MAVIHPTMTPTFLPKKPKLIKPSTTPAPIVAIISNKYAVIPVNETQFKRTIKKLTKAMSTDQLKALAVTLSQYRLEMTGKTIAPHNAPTKINIDKISNLNVAKMMPHTVAMIMVIRPIQSIF